MSFQFETTNHYIYCNIQFYIFIYLFPIGYDTFHLRVRRYRLINQHIIMQHIVGQLLYIYFFFFFFAVKDYSNKGDSKC